MKKDIARIALKNTKLYWQKFVKEHDKMGINKKERIHIAFEEPS